ncbi:MAG: hypothetical protein HY706_22375 [Candidatus Hydrogenedentes bacterium]|nr:hypothetical protein [Candidatus Hydrogenedentota bacterium]
MRNLWIGALLIGILIGAAGCPDAQKRSDRRERREAAAARKQLEEQKARRRLGHAQAEAAILQPIPNQLGFMVAGPYGLTATLTKEKSEDPEWRLHGKFVFNTAGYAVGYPVVALSKSLPEKVFVTFSVSPPADGAVVAQMQLEVPIDVKIRASSNASFTVQVATVKGSSK